ncbi:MAG: VacJ family lipoprotein [Kiritimatiellia bacterium]
MKISAILLTCLMLLNPLRAQDDFEFDEFDDFEEEIQRQVDITQVPDPVEPVNRGVFWLNDKLYFYALKPVALGFRTVTPKPVRQSIHNFFNNLGFPQRLVNNLLQLKFRGAAEELRNFTFNTTAGCLGFVNLAENNYGWEARDEDFGQTMAHYGAGPWMAVHLPLFGPSNLRDSVGLIPDLFLDPVMYVDSLGTRLAIRASDRVNYTSLHIGFYEDIKKEKLDVYRFMQDAYEQNRAEKIKE